VTLKMPAFEWVHVQLHQQKGMISLSPPTICNSAQGKAWPLIEGSGTIYGMYVIEGLNQTKTEFFRDGMPRRIEFTLSLKRVDESLSDMFGDLSAQLNNLQDTATSALSDISKTVGGLLS
ncbi:phage tail protein, partial [Escherichia coli]